MDVAIGRSDGLGEGVLRFPRVLFSLLFVTGLVVCGAAVAARPIAPDGGDLRWNATGQQARAAPSASSELRNRASNVQKADAPSADAAAIIVPIERLVHAFHADASGLRCSDASRTAPVPGNLQARAPPVTDL